MVAIVCPQGKPVSMESSPNWKGYSQNVLRNSQVLRLLSLVPSFV